MVCGSGRYTYHIDNLPYTIVLPISWVSTYQVELAYKPRDIPY